MTGSLTLQNNEGDDLTITANGNFTFATAVATDGDYSVTVSTQPTGHTCTVTNGTGTISANITNVTVSCVLSDAATAFSLLINPKITLSTACIACHSGTSAGSLHNIGNDEATNRTKLMDYFSANGITLFKAKVSADPSHGGGDQTGNLPLADIDTWHQLEQN